MQKPKLLTRQMAYEYPCNLPKPDFKIPLACSGPKSGSFEFEQHQLQQQSGLLIAAEGGSGPAQACSM
jgi:hypothetical protein